MKTDKISIQDLQGIGTDGRLTVELPDFKAVVSARSLCSQMSGLRPRTDGMVYVTDLDKEAKENGRYILTIELKKA